MGGGEDAKALTQWLQFYFAREWYELQHVREDNELLGLSPKPHELKSDLTVSNPHLNMPLDIKKNCLKTKIDGFEVLKSLEYRHISYRFWQASLESKDELSGTTQIPLKQAPIIHFTTNTSSLGKHINPIQCIEIHFFPIWGTTNSQNWKFLIKSKVTVFYSTL